MPGLFNSSVLSALFSLTATGLYSSYIIPILLRITVARTSFVPAEWNLGRHSLAVQTVAFLWGLLMIIVLCLPSVYPVEISNLNYSPLALGAILIYALASWHLGAKRWFRGAAPSTLVIDKALGLLTEDAQEPSSEEDAVRGGGLTPAPATLRSSMSSDALLQPTEAHSSLQLR